MAAEDPRTTHATPRRWRRIGIFALLGTALAGAGAAAWSHRGACWGQQSTFAPELAQKRADLIVEHLLHGTQATAEQTRRIGEIVTAMVADLRPLREQRTHVQRAIIDLVTRPTVERDAIEALRADQLRRADVATQRLAQAITDIALILTPEQRVAIAKKLQRIGPAGAS